MIDTRGLQFAYPDGPPLRFDDVAVAQGGTLLLQGPSGSGKSTWLALVAGLLNPMAGDVVVAGQALGALRGGERDRWRARSLGFLPQRLHLSEALTVGDNLALVYFAAGQAVDRRAIAGALSALELEGLAQRRPSQLSGGQAQRAALAQALLLRPQVILADEPTTSLDDSACAAALALLGRCASQQGATLVIATHDARVRQSMPQAQVLPFALPLAVKANV